MGSEYFTLTVGGYNYSSWKQASCTYGAKQAARAFACTVSDATGDFSAMNGEEWNYMPGTEVQVSSNGDLIATCLIDKMTPSYDEKNHTVNISGRSKGKDAIDSSAHHSTCEFRNKTPLEIAQALDEQGIGYSSDVQLDQVPLFRINRGETVYSAIERVCRKQQVFCMGQPDGSIKLTKGGTQRVHPALIEGQNIKGANATFDESGQHSEYKVKGQKIFGSDSKALRVEQTSTNSAITRKRPKHILPESDVAEDTAQKRADKHRDRQAANSISASVKVQGWHDENGVLWTPNTLIFIYSPRLKLSMDLLLDNVSLTYDENGSFSQLSFVQPATLGSSASTGSKTDPVWQQNF